MNSSRPFWRRVLSFLKAFGVIAAALGAGVQIYHLWMGDRSVLTWVLTLLSLVVAIVALALLAFAKKPSPLEANRRIPRFDSWVRWTARVILLAILVGLVVGVIVLQSRWNELEAKTVVLVAEFQGPEPSKYGLSDEIMVAAQSTSGQSGDVVVLGLGDVILQWEGSGRAREEGERRRAEIVIWGRYILSDAKILLTLYVENLTAYPGFPKTSIYTIDAPLSMLQTFDVQRQISLEMEALLLFVMGIPDYAHDNHQRAIDRFSQALRSDRSQFVDLGVRARMYQYRGTAYFFLDSVQAAILDLRQSITLDPSSLQASATLGGVYIRAGMYEDGLEECNRFIAKEGEIQAVLLNRGICRFFLGHYQLAIEDLERAKVTANPPGVKVTGLMIPIDRHTSTSTAPVEADVNPDWRAIDQQIAECYNRIGMSLSESGQSTEALGAYTRAISSDSTNASAFANRGNIRADLGNDSAAMYDYAKALQLNPRDINTLSNRATLLLNKADYRTAYAQFDSIYTMHPAYERARWNRGVCALRLGWFERGIGDLDFFLDSQLRDIVANSDFRSALRKENIGKGLLKEYDRAIADGSSEPHFRVGRARAHILMGRKSLALQDLDRAEQLTTRTSSSELSLRGLVLALTNRNREAIDLLTRALSVDSNEIASLNFRARLLNDMGHTGDAISDLRKALAVSPTDTVTMRQLYGMLISEGFEAATRRKPEEALQMANQAISVYAAGFEALMLRGMMYSELKKFELGMKDLERAYVFSNRDSVVTVNRALALYRYAAFTMAKGDPASAIPLLSEALHTTPDPDYYALRGEAYINANDPRRAIADLDRCLAAKPYNHTARFNRGVAHERLNENAAAIRDFEAVASGASDPVLAARGRDAAERLRHRVP